MGSQSSISVTQFPRSGAYLGKQVNVCFHCNTSKAVVGTIVRDDISSPFVTIIRLDDGRYVLGTECMYTAQKFEPRKNDD
jgi:hypothetical protein